MSAARSGRPATIPSRMETSAGPWDSPAVVNRSMCLEKKTSPAFDRARFVTWYSVLRELRTGRGKRIRQRHDDNPSRGRADEHQLSGGDAIGSLDRTDDRVANRNQWNV